MIKTLWPALAAIGAGLVLFATAAGAGLAVAIPVGGVAVVEIAWGFSVLRAERLVVPRAAVAGGAVGILGSGFLLLTGPLALIPFLALFVFHWSIAIAAVIEVRSLRAAPAATGRPRRTGVFALVLVAEAMLVAAIATPALAASEAGEFAVPHGTSHGASHGAAHETTPAGQ